MPSVLNGSHTVKGRNRSNLSFKSSKRAEIALKLKRGQHKCTLISSSTYTIKSGITLPLIPKFTLRRVIVDGFSVSNVNLAHTNICEKIDATNYILLLFLR